MSEENLGPESPAVPAQDGTPEGTEPQVPTSDSQPERDPALDQMNPEGVPYGQDKRLAASLRAEARPAEVPQSVDPPPASSTAQEQPQQEDVAPEEKQSRLDKRFGELLGRIREIEQDNHRLRDELAARHNPRTQPASEEPQRQQPREDDGLSPPSRDDFYDPETQIFDEEAYASALGEHAAEKKIREFTRKWEERQGQREAQESQARAMENFERQEQAFVQNHPDYFDTVSGMVPLLYETRPEQERDASGRFTGNTIDVPVRPRNSDLVEAVTSLGDPVLPYYLARNPDLTSRLVGLRGSALRDELLLTLGTARATVQNGRTRPKVPPRTNTLPDERPPITPRGGGTSPVVWTESMVRGKDPHVLKQHTEEIDASIRAGTFYGR